MYGREMEVALQAARLAGDYLLKEYEHFQKIANAPASISTEADRQAQEIILQHIVQAFPKDALCAEEVTPLVKNASATGPRQWVVDPIDGTRGFVMKNGEFSVMIGFVHEGTIGAGVVYQPAVGRLTYAEKGKGCWRLDGKQTSPERCQVTQVGDLGQATLTQSHSKDPSKKSKYVEALKPGRVVESYSAGIKLALVARGDADLYLNTYEAFHDWDICAGHILVAEAGGKVTGTGGEELRYGLDGAWQREGLLASNGKVHQAAVERMKGFKK
jgi:3'(2'), 5'-bisphosphate nucleotidase